ncbi:YfiR family protein [Shewanella sp. TC10]|uniref:YfiR family protein n=1 Tax=Shewanella sp. TC10 TaxID=1419739 RepID=UPI00129D2752|nr:YfiR family protein [Shewanella sp. TC10]
MRNIIQLLNVLLLSLLPLSSQSVIAAEQEHALKAGFLYNFARYGDWQENTAENNEFILCSSDEAFINTARKVLNHRSVDNQPIIMQQITLETEQVNKCQLLFITTKTFSDWLNLKQSQSSILVNTMVVGESQGFIEAGGHIRFFIASGKIRFEISPKQLQQSGITMSSKVLRLGRVLDR